MCANGACEQLKDKIKETDVVTQSVKQKGIIFGSFLGMVCVNSRKKPFKFWSIYDLATALSCTFVKFK